MVAAPNIPEEDDDFLDLDRERALRRELSGKPLTLKLNGNTHELPFELPLDVFQPLEAIDVDVAMLIRLAMDHNGGKDVREDATNVVIDMLITNPRLPMDIIGAIRNMGNNLLGTDAYNDLVAMRPSREDIGVLSKRLFAKYGVGLGESSESSASSAGAGTTSKQTSSGSTKRTRAASGPSPETKAS
jgi:hypothetical protein